VSIGEFFAVAMLCFGSAVIGGMIVVLLGKWFSKP
jgi:hypothetical protein